MHANPFRLLVVALVALAGVTATGCGSDDKSSDTAATPAPQTTTAAPSGDTIAVPDDIKSKGTLVVATDATYAPNEFVGKDGKTVEGMDVDLANAIGAKLGLKVEVKNAGFDGIIPGLAAKKFDLGMSSFTDTKEREQTVDFVTYFSAGTSFYEAAGGPEVTGLESLCGTKVAVEKGTTQADAATAQSKKCTSAGDDPVTVSTYPDQNGANLAISSGRAEIGMADSPVADYIVKQSGGKFESVGTPFGTAPYGIAVPKDSGLADPVLAALKALMKSGEYTDILKKWGVESGAITDPVINGATS